MMFIGVGIAQPLQCRHTDGAVKARRTEGHALAHVGAHQMTALRLVVVVVVVVIIVGVGGNICTSSSSYGHSNELDSPSIFSLISMPTHM